MTTTITDSDLYRCLPAVSKDTLTAIPAKCKRRRRITTAKPETAHDTAMPISKAAILQSATAVRQTLRDSLEQVNALIREVKAQRRQDRILQNTMDSLRKLSLA